MKVTSLDYAILRVVWDSKRPMGPTEIGVCLNYPIETAAQMVQASITKLTSHGLLTRTEKNKRRVYYTRAGEVFPTVSIRTMKVRKNVANYLKSADRIAS